MEKYIITERTVDVTESTTIMPEKNYGGWFAGNEGSVDVKIMGYVIGPGEGLDMKDAVPVGSQYGSPIKIEVPSGGVVRITRLQATPIK